MKNKTICWNAIVKNESAIIERCMSSMVGQIDYWVVVDTGSTDGTQQIIKDFMQRHNIPGELIERPWKNFSHNRSEALEFAENKADYIFLCDADMTLEVIDPDWKEKLGDSPCYNVIQKNNFLRYSNIRLINGRLKGTDRFRYWGATHEYCDSIIGNASRTLFTGIELPDYTDGGAKADKYERDARLLSEELEFLYSLDDADNETIQFAISEGIWQRKDGLIQRCTFYLAQTWRDSEKLELALETYEKRVELNGWAEEVYYSLLQIAILKEKLAYEFDDVVNSYLRAYEYRPHRAESLYHLAKYLRLNDRIKLSYIYAYIAANTSMNDDILFVNYPIYEWKAKDELAVAAYWVGNYKLSYDLCLELLKKNKLDKDTRVRIASNMRFSEEKMINYEDCKYIVLSSDFKYSEHVMTTIKSICMHNDKIVFYLLNKDFPKEWFEHLNFNLYKKDSKIIDIKVNNDSLEKYYTYTGSVATFYRFFIPELIPKDKVLYLDSDLIVTSNLDELYQCSLDDNYVAAVPDLLTELLREDNGSFNAGVMLVNNKMWREHNITQKSLIYYKDNESHILDGDQTVLNALFKDKWKILSNKFNFLTGAELVFKSRCLTNMLARLNDFMGDPTVVHYNTQHKPWKDTGLECSFRELYWFYRNLDWDDIILSKK